MSYEREVDVLDLSQEEEVTVNTTSVTTTSTRSVTREVITPAPADSGLRRREVGRAAINDKASANARFLPCEYYGRDAGAGVLPQESEEEADLERRQARDLLRAIESRKSQQQRQTYDDSGEEYSTARSSYEGEEDERYEAQPREEGEEEEEELLDEDHEERRKLASMKKKGEQYVKRVAKEVEDAGRRGASRVKHRAVATAKRASVWRPSSTTRLLLRLALGGVLTALVCMFAYEYFLGWGPSRPVHYPDGTWRELPPGSKAGSWGIPYLGESIDYYRDPFKFTLRHVRKYGPVSYSNVLGDHTVVLSGSKALGQVFYNSSLVQRRDALPAHIATLLGRDILPALDNSRHAEVRAVIMQAINTRGVIQAHLGTLDRVMNKHMAHWTRQPAPFDLLRDIKDMTASMASTLFFTNDESHYLAPLLDQVLAALSGFPSPLAGSTYQRGVSAKDQLLVWYERAIEDQEVESMHFDPAYPALPFDKLHRTDLLSLFINETRRFYPSAVIEWGKAKLNFEFDGYLIPEDFKVIGAVATTHLDPNDHKNPEEFDPTRFAEEVDNEYSYVPQGGGPRDSPMSHRCVGEDLSFYTVKLFLMNLLARHEWTLAAGQNVNFDTAHYLPEPHSLRASSFSNTSSPISFSAPSASLPYDYRITPDHITIAVA